MNRIRMVLPTPLSAHEAHVLDRTWREADRETNGLAKDAFDPTRTQGRARRVMARADQKRADLGLVVVDGLWCKTR